MGSTGQPWIALPSSTGNRSEETASQVCQQLDNLKADFGRGFPPLRIHYFSLCNTNNIFTSIDALQATALVVWSLSYLLEHLPGLANPQQSCASSVEYLHDPS